MTKNFSLDGMPTPNTARNLMAFNPQINGGSAVNGRPKKPQQPLQQQMSMPNLNGHAHGHTASNGQALSGRPTSMVSSMGSMNNMNSMMAMPAHARTKTLSKQQQQQQHQQSLSAQQPQPQQQLTAVNPRE